MPIKRRTSTLFLILLFGVFIVLLAPRVVHVISLQERSNNLETELQKLRRQNQYLENQLRLLREDPVYLEKVAREKFNKAKQGEIVYKIVREGETPSSQ